MTVVKDNSSSSSSDNADEIVALIEDTVETQDELELEASSRTKRLKLDSTVQIQESTTSTSPGTMKNKLDVCKHLAGTFKDMCVVCGQKLDEEESGVTLEYIHKGLKIKNEEISRLSSIDMKKLLRNKKLCLVLDLDHTLLNATQINRLSKEEMPLKTQTHSREDISQGSLFMLENLPIITKLRPFVRTFLQEASEMFEMYIYTMAGQRYAKEMAKLLDPLEEYFVGKVISREDNTQKNQKNLNIVLGNERVILILDDTEKVWPYHKNNLILMARYLFFSSSCQDLGYNCQSLAALHTDENENNGVLAKILQVLKQIHSTFYDDSIKTALAKRDVRQVLSSHRSNILSECVIVFSRKYRNNLPPLRKKAWEMGASCSNQLDPATVTHVVAPDVRARESLWAMKENKFLVSPGWIEASSSFLQKQPEEEFLVK